MGDTPSDNAHLPASDSGPKNGPAGRSSAALIREIADKVAALLASYRDLDDELLRDPRFNGSKRKDAKRLQERVIRSQAMTHEERVAAHDGRQRASEIRGRIGEEIADQYERLSAMTFPAHDPEAYAEMHRFLHRVLEEDRGRFQQRGNLLFSLVRLGNAIDHPQAGWYVGTWLLAAVAQRDYTLAEALMSTVYEHPEIGLLVTSNKPATLALLPLARSLIALQRDGDWDAALEHARDARRTCGFDPRAAATCEALEAAHAEAVRLLDCTEAEADGDLLIPINRDLWMRGWANNFDLRPLTTGTLDWSPPERQLEGDDAESLRLEHDDDAA